MSVQTTFTILVLGAVFLIGAALGVAIVQYNSPEQTVRRFIKKLQRLKD